MRSNEKELWQDVFAGAVGGLAAACAMNEFQSLWAKAAKELSPPGDSAESGGEGENATVKTAEALSKTLFHHELDDTEKKWAGPAVHYAFGMMAGAVYGFLAHVVPKSRACFGTAYGSALWLTADEMAVPAFGLSKPPEEYPAISHVRALASHLAYGLALEASRRTTLRLLRGSDGS